MSDWPVTIFRGSDACPWSRSYSIFWLLQLPDTECYGPLAQLVEQQTLNLRVVGSSPTRLTRF
jgi:hypothetical protein